MNKTEVKNLFSNSIFLFIECEIVPQDRPANLKIVTTVAVIYSATYTVFGNIKL